MTDTASRATGPDEEACYVSGCGKDGKTWLTCRNCPTVGGEPPRTLVCHDHAALLKCPICNRRILASDMKTVTES
eukprot:6188652-Amphidinium_carterae.1